MAQLDVVPEDVANAVAFLEQFLRAKLPQYDFAKGTANRDIAINAVALTVAFMRKEVANVKNRQSLLRLSEVDADDSVDELVDEILSDWFISRKAGRPSQGTAVLSFSQREIGTIVLTNVDSFVKDDASFVLAVDTAVISAADLVANTDQLGVTFYTAKIPLVAVVAGVDGDVDIGSFDSWPAMSPFLMSVDASSSFTGGASVETSEALIERSKTVISVRDLNTAYSIQTVLTDTFPQVLEVAPIGYGDPEFQRDRLEITKTSGNTIVIHRGSMVDAYLKMPMDFSQVMVDLTVVSGANFGFSFPAMVQLPQTPIYKIRGVFFVDTATQTTVNVDYAVYTEAPELWNSNRQQAFLVVGSDLLNQNLTMVYDTVVGYAAVQDFVSDKRNRIITADVLAKASFAMYLKFDLGYYRSATSEIDLVEAAKMLQDFVHSRAMGATFRVAELVDVFSRAYPGNVARYPFVVVGEIILPNGKVLTLNYTDKILVPEKYAFDPDDPDTLTPLFAGDLEPEDQTVVLLADLQVSQRTLRYVAATEDITITAV